MFKKTAMTAVVLGTLTAGLALSEPAQASERSPVFGRAQVSTMSSAQTRNVTARGYYANYYGSLAVDNAYNSYIYAYYARYYAATNSSTEQSWYYTAHSYAYYAYLYSYYAYLYSYYGQ